jgi:hypothetical protein
MLAISSLRQSTLPAASPAEDELGICAGLALILARK